MPPTTNRQVRLKSRPEGIPQAEHFEIAAAPLEAPRERQVQVRLDYLSVDPAMRGWVNAAQNYSRPVGIGEAMRSYAVGEGKLAYREDVLEGIEACPDAIAGLYRGDNLGKRLVRLRH